MRISYTGPCLCHMNSGFFLLMVQIRILPRLKWVLTIIVHNPRPFVISLWDVRRENGLDNSLGYGYNSVEFSPGRLKEYPSRSPSSCFSRNFSPPFSMLALAMCKFDWSCVVDKQSLAGPRPMTRYLWLAGDDRKPGMKKMSLMEFFQSSHCEKPSLALKDLAFFLSLF